MDEHSDFIVGEMYFNCGGTLGYAYCVGHSSEGKAVVQCNKWEFYAVLDPGLWEPSKLHSHKNKGTSHVLSSRPL